MGDSVLLQPLPLIMGGVDQDALPKHWTAVALRPGHVYRLPAPYGDHVHDQGPAKGVSSPTH